MNELLFIPIIGVLGIVSTIVASKGSLYDKRFKWHSRLTLRGWFISAIGLSIVGLSVWQYITTKKEDTKKEVMQAQQTRFNDSIITAEIKKGVDSNRRQLFNDLSEALAKQALRLDTVTKNIRGLRDSPKTVIYNSPKEIPQILVQSDGIKTEVKDSTVRFEIEILSTLATSNVVFINYLYELNYADGSKSRTKLTNLIGEIIIPKDRSISKGFSGITNKEIKFINIALLGIYYSSDGLEKIKLEEVYNYSFTTKKTSLLDSEPKERFLKFYNIK